MLTYLDPVLFPDDIEIVEMSDGRLVYPIFKNGSSSIKGSAHQLIPISQIRDRVEHVHVYLRDPMERFVSGVQTYLSYHPELDKATVLEFVNRYLFLDRHFLPQFHWLLNLARQTQPDCVLSLHSIDELEDITDNTWNVLSRDKELFDLFAHHSKLNFYLGPDKVLFHDLKGKSLTFSMIVRYLKEHCSEVYTEIIQRSKDLCAVLD